MKVGVIGAGSWGTALAQLLANDRYNVNIWARRPEQVRAINTNHRNPDYLKDLDLSESVVATVSHEDCLRNSEGIIVATPSKLLRGVARALADCTPDDMRIVICSKGIEAESGCLATQIFEQEMGHPERIAIMSGPNHAEEVSRCIPSATVIASESKETATYFQALFALPYFRAYTSKDVIGVQICGAYKNIIAISVGLSYGLGYGDNTAAVLITRGMAEMSRLVSVMGGDPRTCMGLAGSGDLVATSMSHHSRNRNLGELLAVGQTLEDFHEQTHMIAEGAVACQTVLPVAHRHGVELPIAEVVNQVIWEDLSAQEAATSLLQRPLKMEF